LSPLIPNVNLAKFFYVAAKFTCDSGGVIAEIYILTNPYVALRCCVFAAANTEKDIDRYKKDIDLHQG
jgi:hypothetical protein